MITTNVTFTSTGTHASTCTYAVYDTHTHTHTHTHTQNHSIFNFVMLLLYNSHKEKYKSKQAVSFFMLTFIAQVRISFNKSFLRGKTNSSSKKSVAITIWQQE